jgi:hypothetical protein
MGARSVLVPEDTCVEIDIHRGENNPDQEHIQANGPICEKRDSDDVRNLLSEIVVERRLCRVVEGDSLLHYAATRTTQTKPSTSTSSFNGTTERENRSGPKRYSLTCFNLWSHYCLDPWPYRSGSKD